MSKTIWDTAHSLRTNRRIGRLLETYYYKIQFGYFPSLSTKVVGSLPSLIELFHRDDKIVDSRSIQAILPFTIISNAIYFLVQPDCA